MDLAAKQGPSLITFIILFLIIFIITIAYCLDIRDADSLRPQGSCSNINVCCSSSSKHLCTWLTCTASHRTLSVFSFRAVRKIHPRVPAAVRATLFGKQELPTCNIFSLLSSDLSTASQSSIGAHMERTCSRLVPYAICWPLASSIHWSLRLLCAALCCA